MPDLPIPSERLLASIAGWKSKLLDLSKRNRAISFKVNKVSTVTVVDELPTEIFRLLCAEKRALSFRPSDDSDKALEPEEQSTNGLFDLEAPDEPIASREQPIFQPYETEQLAANFVDDILQTNSTAENLDRSLRRIDEQARSILEEQGVNALFLALGVLHYFEDERSDVPFKAPLLLVPVELVRKSAREGFKVRMTDEEVIVNPSLIEYLRRDFGIVLPEIATDGTDMQPFFAECAEAISSKDRWKITNEIYLSLFSFQKLVMYKDLEKNGDRIAAHRIFRQMIDKDGPNFIGLPEGMANLELDKHFAPENCIQVVDADSSQLRALATISQNYDLVLEGPPGTGKSQTITNLIAHALSTGKTVLFVAEKMAALDVVYRRLCEVGVGEFCLQLHSTKANKKAVMEELRKTLDASLERVKSDASGTARLPVVRDHLTAYVNAVHASYGSLGMTPYQAFGEFDGVRDQKRLPFHGDIGAITKVDFDDTVRHLNDLLAAAQPITSPNHHPWHGARKTFYSETDIDAISLGGDLILSKLATLIDDASSLEKLLGLPRLETIADLEVAGEVAAMVARSPGVPLNVLSSEAWNSAPPEAMQLIDEGRKLSITHSHLTDRFEKAVFDVDPTDEIAYVERKSEGIFSFLAILDSRYRAIRRRWIALRRLDDSRKLIDQAIEMRAVADYLARRVKLAEQATRSTEIFGPLWRGEASDWDALTRYTDWVVDFRRMYVERGLREQAIATASQASPDLGFIQELRTKANELKDLITDLAGLVGWPDGYFVAAGLDLIRTRLSGIVGSVGQAHKWAGYEMARQRLECGFAVEVLEWIAGDQVIFDELIPVFKRSFFQKWLAEVVSGRQELREFHTLSHEERVREFKELDELVLRQNRIRLVDKMRSGTQASLQVSPIKEQMLTLRTQLNRQRGLLPLRTTMLKCFDAVRAIKPCFMMSPQSVAQLLDAERSEFDLVVFDEASQLPTEDAVGAIFRGEQLVVVGDPKQLPPTNFFAVTSGQVNVLYDEDGLPLFDDTQSILEEVASSGVPNSRLKWHYRSAHESLITFSNSTFYNSDLYTFPSVDTGPYDSGLHFEYVPDGVYEGKGLNIIEARRVADAVVDEIKKDPNVSLAVGTFNTRQQTAIWDELEIRRRADPSIESFFDRGRQDYFFVKNLENIQGDERDVIFLSVTYGPGPDNKIRYNLGPLNGENGGRRMNVLVTRARRLMRVFSSIRADEINLAATASRGAKLLRDFLMYAERRILDSPIVSAIAEVESPFEAEVLAALSTRGLTLIPQVGASGYRIDFGVVDAALPGRFVCGIECDGFAYHRSETARDRDRLRQQVLEGRGWEIHRIWSTDWFKDRGGQIDRIMDLVAGSQARATKAAEERDDLAKQARVAAEEEARDFLGDLKPIGSDELKNEHQSDYVRPVAVPYQYAEVTVSNTFGSLLYATTQQVAQVVLTIAEIESPIHIKEMYSRAAGAWGQKAGTRISDRIHEVVRLLEQAKHIELRGEFILAKDRPIILRSRAGINMPADHLPPDEISEAIRSIVADGHKFDRSALLSEVRAVFGYNRAGAGLQTAIGQVIDNMIGKGMLGEGSIGIGLRG